MDIITLDAQPRDTGKKATKAVRAAGLVPCVLYGTHTEPVHFSVKTLALRPLIHTTDTHRVGVSMDGTDHEAIVKEIVFHPVTEQPLHVDFQALTVGEALTMVVPVQLEGSAPGVKNGGVLMTPLHEVEIRALPKDIPGHLTVDISGLQVGDSVTVADIAVGGSVEILTDPELTIAAVNAPSVAEADDEAEAEAEA
jgi:large subunit ribosomal protein L25